MIDMYKGKYSTKSANILMLNKLKNQFPIYIIKISSKNPYLEIGNIFPSLTYK